jgi:hypothetical protein
LHFAGEQKNNTHCFEWVLLNTLYSPFSFEDGFYQKADQKPQKSKHAVEQNACVPRGRLRGVLLGMRVKIPNNVRAVPQKSANKGNHKRIQKNAPLFQTKVLTNALKRCIM